MKVMYSVKVSPEDKRVIMNYQRLVGNFPGLVSALAEVIRHAYPGIDRLNPEDMFSDLALLESVLRSSGDPGARSLLQELQGYLPPDAGQGLLVPDSLSREGYEEILRDVHAQPQAKK
ncbi:MAG: hypothetical protein ACP5G5_04980 [Thermoplasmata archaeon]|jgi:hypothetical protein